MIQLRDPGLFDESRNLDKSIPNRLVLMNIQSQKPTNANERARWTQDAISARAGPVARGRAHAYGMLGTKVTVNKPSLQ
jgi:hypothetical protein